MAGVSYTSKLSEPKCHNWIKAALALFITKEGIEPFVYKEVQEFQWKCLSDICYNNNIPAGGLCSSCSTENVVVCLNDRKCNAGRGKCAYHTHNPTQYLNAGCPNRICHNFKKKIQAAHCYLGPSYKNTDARQWCTEPWELAKCFMPQDGYKDITSAEKTDFNGINSVVLNFRDIQAKISDDLSKKGNLFEKGREISRAVRHSPNLEIDDSDLQQYFINLSNLLSDPKCLAGDQDAQMALKKLMQLQKDTLVIGKEDVRRVLDDVANAVKDKIRNEIDEQKKKAEEQKLELLKQMDKSVNAIKDQEKLSLSEVKSALSYAIRAVDETVEKGKQKLTADTKKSLKKIKMSTDESVGKIKSEEKTVITVVQTGKKQIEEVTNESLGKITLEQKAIKSEGEKFREEIQAGRELIEKVTDEFVRKIRLDTEPEAISSDGSMRKLVEGLQSDLISLYRETCSTIPICPCLEEVDASMVEFYITPYPLYSTETDRLKLMSKQRKKSEEQTTDESKIDTLSGMFVKNSKDCRNIYVTAEPGFGKTSLVKWLVLNWCQALCPEGENMKSFNENDVDYLRNFKFLFLVYLRGAAEKDDIESMIYSQIIPLLGNKLKYTPDVLEEVLLREKCLIVLDGLDEWTSADKSVLIPKRSSREKSTYLTTSRPWKFSMLSLKSTQIDQHIQIKNLENMHTERLVHSLFSIFKRKNCLLENMQPETAAQTFIHLLQAKNLNAFLTTPFMLLQMGFVWNQTGEIGNSFCKIYTEMVDVLLTVAEKKNPGRLEKFKNKGTTDLRCFESSLCGEYFAFMLKVGKLAFETLCSESEESTLVFEEKVANKHLSGADVLKDCLKVGVLSEQHLYSDARRKRYMYSFHHKSIQEYFAAVYLQSMYEEDSHTVEVLKRKCQSVAAVLEMGTVFKFLSGFNHKIVKEVLQSLQPVICSDRTTKLYRIEMPPKYFDDMFFEMKSLQDMIVSCVIESTNNGHKEQDLPLEDVIIDDSCCQDSYCSVLNTLIKSNSTYIKSLYVSGFYMNLHVLKSIEFEAIQSVLSLYVNKLAFPKCMPHLLERSVQHLKCFKLLQEFGPEYTSHSEAMKIFKTLKEAKQLVVLNIENIQVNHDVLQMFLLCLSKNIYLRDISLHNSETGPMSESNNEKLELTHHSDLKKLSLRFVHVSQLQLNEHLQELTLFHVPVSQLQLNDHLKELTLKNVLVSQLQLNDHLRKLTLEDVPVSQLQLNDYLKELTLVNVPLSQLQLNDHLKELTLKNVLVSQLQLNDHLKKLTLVNVPLSQLQLNDYLKELTLVNVPVSQLQLNDHLKELTLVNVPLSQLQLHEHVKRNALLNLFMNQDSSQHHCEGLPVWNEQLHNQPTPSIALLNVDKASSLTSCWLCGEVGTVIRDLVAVPNLNLLILIELTTESVMILSETLSRLVHVAEIDILKTDIGKNDFVLTPGMTNIKYVDLFEVSMTSNTFLGFIGSVLKSKNVIVTRMLKCTVKDVSSLEQKQEQDVMSLSPTPKEYMSGSDMKMFEVIHAVTSNRTLNDFVNILNGSPSPVSLTLSMNKPGSSEKIDYFRSSPFFTIQSEDNMNITFIMNR